MQSFFFGDPHSQLLGVYHPPPSSAAGNSGAVLCSPAGAEYGATQRALRVLASRLAKAGFHTLRFDYFATGDSAGESEEADFDCWQNDISLAVDELRESRGVSAVTLVGLRLGAALAALTATRRSDIDALVLWEPVVNGKAHLDRIRSLHRLWLKSELTMRPEAKKHCSDHEALGYPLSNEMAQAIARLDLLDIDGVAARRILVIGEDGNAADSVHDAWVSHPLSTLERRKIAEPTRWLEQPENSQQHVPAQSIGAIVEWLTGAMV